MALCTCGGADVLSGELHLPLRGCWWAELILDTATLPSGSVELAAAGGLTLHGTVYAGGVFRDAAHVRLAGGAAGMGELVAPRAYANAQARDPLSAITDASGDTLSTTISPGILGAQVPVWTLTQKPAAAALDELLAGVGAVLGQELHWRFLSDGALWIGEESWPAATLPQGDDLLEPDPAAGRYTLGVTTPSLLPGVNLESVGQVVGVDHHISHDKVRTFAWT